MSLPNSPSTTYAPGSMPAIKSADLNDQQLWLAYLYNNRLNALLGNGSDPGVVLDGTTTVPWATKTGSLYTLNRSIFIDANGLTVAGAGVQLATHGSRIYCRGTVRTLGGAIIHANGAAAVGQNGGVASQSGILMGSLPGAAHGSAATGAYAAAGGVGGLGGKRVNPGGAITNVISPTDPGLCVYSPELFGLVALPPGVGAYALNVIAVAGGTGGGGGADVPTVGIGAGGGAGGAVLAIAAFAIVLTNATDLQCMGGAGAPVTPDLTYGWGGGGGGGGLMLLACGQLTVLNGGSLSSAQNCAGGAGGLGAVSGFPGAPGLLVQLPL